MRKKKLISYELNEVPERVFRHFSEWHPTSTVARLFHSSRRFKTLAPDEGELSPWITWPTLHRAVPNREHCISDFGQDLGWVNREFPSVWQLLATAGVSTGVFGSLHSYPVPEDLAGYAFFVPDSFAPSPKCFPEELNLFQDLNIRMIAQSGRNVNKGIEVGPAARFMLAAPKLGLRPSTVARLGKQLLDERFNATRHVRRRTSQVQIAFDLYEALLGTRKPEFSSFFTNHVASAMHRYWPATFPEDYVVKTLSPEWKKKYGDEIDFTMREADRQLGRLVRFTERNPDFALLVTTSMGQAAVDDLSVTRTQLYIADLPRFMHKMGVEPEDWQQRPAMLPNYILRISQISSDKFRSLVNTIEINGEQVKVVEHEESVFRIHLGHANLDPAQISLRVAGQDVDYRDWGLENTAIEDETGSYAYHIAEGVLLAFDPEARGADAPPEPVPTTAIAPAILQHFGIDPPGYMRDAGRFRLFG